MYSWQVVPSPSEAEQFGRVLTENLGGICDVSATQLLQLYGHYRLLLHWNKALNLTSIEGLEETVVRHYCESLFLGTRLSDGGLSVLDVGSGAGFPGIPMAVLRPDCRFTLAESDRRKAVFLRESTRGWPTIVVFPCRAERLEERFDWVVSRAVRWRQVLRIGIRLGYRLGLLAGEADAEQMRGVAGVCWDAPVRLPWGERRVFLVGTVSRGT